MTYTPQQIVEKFKRLLRDVDEGEVSDESRAFVKEIEEEIKGNESVDTLGNDHPDNLNKV